MHVLWITIPIRYLVRSFFIELRAACHIFNIFVGDPHQDRLIKQMLILQEKEGYE